MYNIYKNNMFAISTSDYAISKGNRSQSPCTTSEERVIIESNQINKRKTIEEELKKIPINEQNNLIILMKCLNSDYVKQIIEVKVIKEIDKYDVLSKLNENINSFDKQKQFNEYSPNVDSSIYPEIWKDFNYKPFQTKQDKNQLIEKIYLSVPFAKKDYAKNKGCKWDAYKKKWYIFNNNKNKEDLIKEFPDSIKKINSFKEQQEQLKRNLNEDENDPKCILCNDFCVKHFNTCYDCYKREKNPEYYLDL